MLWKRLKDDASHLHEIGSAPYGFHPRTKGHEQADEGYGTYDLYDLGSSTKKGPYAPSMELNRNFKEMIEGTSPEPDWRISGCRDEP